MGWDIGASGFRIVLSAGVPEVVEEHLGDDMSAFLGDHDLKTGDIVTWVAHPGGPKVLDAMERTLDLRRTAPATAPGRRWPGSATCRRPRCCTCSPTPSPTSRRRPGSPGVLLAMGPGLLLRAGAAAVVSSDALYVGLVAGGRRRAAGRAGASASATAAGRWRAAASSRAPGTTRRWWRCTPACWSARWPRCCCWTGRSCPCSAGRCWRWCWRRRRCAGGASRPWAGSGAPASSSCPGSPRVTTGPYRWLQHPNYLAVVVEGFALPLVHTRLDHRRGVHGGRTRCCCGPDRRRGAALQALSPRQP